MKYIFYLLIFSPLWGFAQSGSEKYTRQWGTYFGDAPYGSMVINQSSLDENGNLWIAGRIPEEDTEYMDSIISENAHQSIYGGGDIDGFIAKFSPEGALLYASYFGGEGNDKIKSLDVSGGKVYIVGETQSENNIATAGAYEENPKRGFIAQFDIIGQLNWSTYYDAESLHIKAGKSNDFYILGDTSSAGMATSGAFLETIPPPYLNADGEYENPSSPIIARFNDDGSLIWATYYTPDIDETNDYNITTYWGGLGIDQQNNVYLSGMSDDTEGYYGTPGAHQTMSNGIDCFVSKFSSSGEREWSTYFGGESGEIYGKMQILNNNILLLSGLTVSQTGIATPGAWKTSNEGVTMGFITQLSLNQNGQQLWGTYTFEVGGLQFFGINSYGNILVYSHLYAEAVEDIDTEGSYQESCAGELDASLFSFNATGNELLYFTFYGGEYMENKSGWNTQISISDDDELYMIGRTESHDNMVSENAFQSDFGNDFIAKFVPCPGAITPTGEAEQEFLFGDTLDSLEVDFMDWTGSELIVTWYADAEGTEVLPPGTILGDGETYYVSQQIRGCDESGLLAISVTKTMGIADKTFANLKLYPNPNKGKFTLSGLPGEAVQILLYDIRGREIYGNDYEGAKSVQINLEGRLRAGIYFLEVSSLAATEIIRVLVK